VPIFAHQPTNDIVGHDANSWPASGGFVGSRYKYQFKI
jgi:hypothetical protein